MYRVSHPLLATSVDVFGLFKYFYLCNLTIWSFIDKDVSTITWFCGVHLSYYCVLITHLISSHVIWSHLSWFILSELSGGKYLQCFDAVGWVAAGASIPLGMLCMPPPPVAVLECRTGTSNSWAPKVQGSRHRRCHAGGKGVFPSPMGRGLGQRHSTLPQGLALVCTFSTASAMPLCLHRWIVTTFIAGSYRYQCCTTNVHRMVIFAIGQFSCTYWWPPPEDLRLEIETLLNSMFLVVNKHVKI